MAGTMARGLLPRRKQRERTRGRWGCGALGCIALFCVFSVLVTIAGFFNETSPPEQFAQAPPASTTVEPVSPPTTETSFEEALSSAAYPSWASSYLPTSSTTEPTHDVGGTWAHPSPTTPAAPQAGSSGCYPLNNKGACYKINQYCRPRDRGLSGVDISGNVMRCVPNPKGQRWIAG